MQYIQFENVNKYFGSHHVLKDINIEIEQGKLVTFLGPSGCGKSTLLRCLAGLEDVSSGSIYLDGVDITNLSAKKRGIGMVFQQYSLFPNMTVEQNIAFGLHIQKMEKAVIREKVKHVLQIVGLEEKMRQYPRQLSGGQQQRVALARAIVMEPKVLLLDEPLSAIDALLRKNLQLEIRRIQKELGITTLFVTHDQDEAMVMSDEIFLFNVGTIEQSGAPVDLYTKPETRFAATFIGHYNILDGGKFSEMAGRCEISQTVAFRPEIVSMNADQAQCAKDDVYCIKGKIHNSVTHGSVIRYSVACGDAVVDADILFDKSRLMNIGDEVYLTIPKEDVIELV